MIKYGLPSFGLIALIVAIVSIAKTQPSIQKVPPPASPPVSVYDKGVGAVGLVEASTENISISLPVPGLVTHVYVRSGDQVRKGDKLFSLDDRGAVAELAQRQSAMEVAQKRLDRLRASPRPEEVPLAEARVREAEELVQDAAVQLRLIESVQDPRARREEDLLRRRIAVDAAKAKLAQAQAALALLKAGSWKPDIDVATAEVNQALAQVTRAQADVDRLTVTAPIEGEILQCKVRAGEYAQVGPLPQPLILMGNTSRLHVRADVDEQDAWRVRAGAAAVASPRGEGSTHHPLHFVRFEPYVIPKKNLTNDATERTDSRVLQVIFALDRGAPLRPGQQVDVQVRAQ
jgi:multidrug resistance efflux pump